MLSRREFIKEGDWAIAYEAYNMMKIFQVKTGDMLQNRLGSFRHEDFIGKRYGTPMNCLGKLNSKCIILHMSPYLWTAALSVRTQILFQVDISMVLYHLDLRPGSIVLESGTGSGSLTTSMARVVAPHGHIHSFEFNADRVEKANIDFKNNKLDDVVTCRHRDVCAKGFPFFPQGVDAVFLDLPTPWEALDDCHRNLRPQGRVCSFSPCIEQVQRVCNRLNELKYEDIITIECLLRPFDVHPNRMKILDLDSLESDFHRAHVNVNKRPAAETAKVEVVEAASTEAAADESEDAKRVKVADGEANNMVKLPAAPAASPRVALTRAPPSASTADVTYLSRPMPVMRGHTGYLTFARKPCGPPADAPVAAATDAQPMGDEQG